MVELSKLIKLFQKTIKPNSKGIILAHENADLDAIGSALGIRLLLNQKKWSIGIPSKANEAVLFWCANNDVALLERPILDEYSHLVIVDFSGFEMTGPLEDDLRRFSGNVLLIDHHQPSKNAPIKPTFSFIDSKQFSCSQIIAQEIVSNSIKPDHRTARALIAGIVWDTGKFARANQATFEIVSLLLPHAKQAYAELIFSMSPRHDVSDRMAKIKSLQRAQLFVADHILLTQSNVSLFQAACADQLILAGSDIAIVSGSPTPNVTQVSFRASEWFVKEFEFNFVTHVIDPLIKEIGGQGGGHAGASGFRTKGINLDELNQKCHRLIEEVLFKKMGKKVLFKASD